MFNKKTDEDSNAEIVRLLTAILAKLNEGRFNAILAGVIASTDNHVVVRAAGSLLEVATEADSAMKKGH